MGASSRVSDRGKFLASREWGVLKKAVHERSGGICEHCHRARAVEVHHETYERFGGGELLEDLLDLCRPCHQYKSGLSNYNPFEPPPLHSLAEARKRAQAELRAQADAGNPDAIDRLETLRTRGLLVGS